VANVIKAKTPEEICRVFNIGINHTPEEDEEEQIRDELRNNTSHTPS
jgi:hypothetical protein